MFQFRIATILFLWASQHLLTYRFFVTTIEKPVAH